MIIILIILIILIKYIFELFSDKHVDEDALINQKEQLSEAESEPELKTKSDLKVLTGTVRAKDRTYNRMFQRYEYATRIVFDNGWADTFSGYDIYMNSYPGQRVRKACYITYDENNNIIRRTFLPDNI